MDLALQALASMGFQENGDTGKRVHGLGGWDKISPESMATYGPRKAARPIPEVRMWMVEGVAGGIAPWWHHVGGYQEDRRQFLATSPFFQWYAKHQQYLIHRKPVATVGVVYSERNFEWYGRDDGNTLALAPYDGMVQALVRARIPYIAVHADNIDRDANKVSVLVLPNLAAMSNSQVESVRRFVSKGGSLVATDETSLYDEYGDRRPDFALGDLFGAKYTGRRDGPRNASGLDHSYLHLTPDVGQDVDGPHHGNEPASSGGRHPALRGFEGTNILTFGGILHEVTPTQDLTAPVRLGGRSTDENELSPRPSPPMTARPTPSPSAVLPQIIRIFTTRCIFTTLATILVALSVSARSARAQSSNTGVPPQLVPYQMQAVAGNNQLPYNAEVGGYGGDGQLGPAATLNAPEALAVDAAGNVYFADGGNALIREVNAQTGIITTVAGQAPSACVGTMCSHVNTGCSDGIAAAGNPIGGNIQGLAIDAYGNLYFSDQITNTVSVVYRGGAKMAAFIALEDPGGVALSNGVQAGFVYHVAGTITLTNCVGIASSGATSTKAAVPAGDGNLAFNSGATFGQVGPLSLDSAGDLYIGDAGINGTIRVINTQAQTQIFFGVPVQPGYIASIVNCGSLTTLCPTIALPLTAANTGIGGPAGAAVFNALANGQGAYMSTDGYGNIYELNYKGASPTIQLGVAYAGGTALANLIAQANLGAAATIANVSGLKAVAGDFYYLLNSITVRPSSVTTDSVGNVYYEDNHYGQIYRIDANAISNSTDFVEISYLTSSGLTSDLNRMSVASNTAPGFCYPFTGQPPSNPVLTGYRTFDQFGNGCPAIYAEGLGVPHMGTGYGTTLADGRGDLYIADRTNEQIRKITLDNIFPLTPVGQQWNSTTFSGEQSVQVHFDPSNLPVYSPTGQRATTSSFSIASGIPDFTINPIEAQWTTSTNSGLIVGPMTFTYSGTVTGAELPVCANTTGANDKSSDCVVNVIFSPTQPGLRQSQLAVATANGGTYTFALTGIGSGSQLAIDGGAQVAVPVTGIANPGQIAVTSEGVMYVADPTNNRVVVVPVGSGTQTTIGTGLKSPLGVAVDGNGNVFISDTGNNRVVEVSQATGAQTVLGGIEVAGTPAYTNYAFKAPQGLAVDIRGNVFIADTGNAKVVEIPSDPKLGGATPLLQYPGAPTFSQPVAIALDNQQNIYVADTGNIQVVKIPAGGGDLQTLPGVLAGFGSVLTAPSGVAVDAAGDVYVSDSGTNRVYELPAASGLTAVTLPINFTGLNLTGTSPSVAAFSGGSIALDANSNLYVADPGNSRVLFDNRQNPVVNCGTVAQDQPAATCGGAPLNAGANTLTVTNIGNQPATITSPFTTVTSSNAAYALTNTCTGTTIPAGGYCTISPTFLPTSDGTQTETFTINGSSQAVTLTGSGEQPMANIVLSSSPTPGAITAGTAVTITATITQPNNPPGGIPTGSVAFSYTVNGGTPVTTTATLTASAGVASASFTIPAVLAGNTYVVNATYQGNTLDSPTTAAPFAFTTALTAALPTASITVSGSIQPGDSSSITVSFNGFTETVHYDSTSTANSVASAFAAMFSRDYLRFGLCASATRNLITFKLKQGTFTLPAVTDSNLSFQLAPAGFP